MYDSEAYLAKKKSDGESKLQRTFFFGKPTLVHKIKLSDITGSNLIAMKVEFLGLDRQEKILSQKPFEGGNVFKSQYLIFSKNK